MVYYNIVYLLLPLWVFGNIIFVLLTVFSFFFPTYEYENADRIHDIVIPIRFTNSSFVLRCPYDISKRAFKYV